MTGFSVIPCCTCFVCFLSLYVDDDKRATQVFYRLMTPCVMNFFQCVCDVKSNRGGR